MCLYPRMITNPKYKPNKKNGGQVPPVSDERCIYVPIGCQKCMECRKQKAREWQTRLLEDIKANKNGKFITLTFSNESIKHLNDQIPETEIKGKYVDGVYREKEVLIEGYERDNAIATKGVRLFLERWRKKFGKSLRHWFVTELGHNGTENVHLHGFVWTDNVEELPKIWQYGFVWYGQKNFKFPERGYKNYVSEQTVNYCVKYVTKQDMKHQGYKSQILTSAGIGRNYTIGEGNWTKNKYNGKETNETYRTRNGRKIAMPIYWRNKIYTEKERELLWVQKLDKNERWICGERVDISGGEAEYYKLLEWYRERNRKLGYGDDKINWSREKYEHERRKLLLSKRISAYAASASVPLD